MAKELLQIGVFYDGNYFLHVSNYYNYFHPVRERINLPGFHDFLRELVAQAEDHPVELCRIAEAHYFRGRLSALEASQRGNQLYNDRVFDDILMSVGVKTHYLPLRARGCRREEKGIDVYLALEAYEQCRNRNLDVLILISSDGEYVPLIRKVNALGVKTMVLNWEFTYTDVAGREVVTRTSQDLLQEVLYPVDASEIIEQGIEANSHWTLDLFRASDGNGDRSEVEAEERDYGPHHDLSDYDESECETLTGTVLNINMERGYGFIKYPPNNLFFYHEDVDYPGFTELLVGDEVAFTIGLNAEGQEVARRVRRLD